MVEELDTSHTASIMHSHKLVILVIDTDSGVRWSLQKGLGLSGCQVICASTAKQARNIAETENIAGILMEMMPNAGLDTDFLSDMVMLPSAPVVVCTSIDANPHLVIDCMRRGAKDFVLKPYSLAEIRTALAPAFDMSTDVSIGRGAFREPLEDAASYIVGVSPPVQEMRTMIKQVAQTDLTCLIRGESGVGKDLVAREIHRLSQRKEKPFVKVNCSALPEQLLESELFGYEKGAFTGAVTSKPGRFSLSDKGIIFLDEICEIHPNLQAKLLQVIEHKEFTKLGGRDSIRVDVQIVAATNADIESMTKDGSFRHDLYFRLNEVCVWVPPLADRIEDIPLLIRHFIQKYKHFNPTAPLELDGEQLAELSERSWPGNIRELESTIKRWIVLGQHDLKRPAARRPKPTQNVEKVSNKTNESITDDTTEDDNQTTKKKRQEHEPEEILEVLERNQWNRKKSADELGISYQVLRRRIEVHNLEQRR